MAKQVIRAAYGKAPDRSYIGGCSNGGRHALVAAARLADEYDGFLVGDPGTVLPRAAIANLAGGKTYAALASNPADLSTGFTLAERQLVSAAVLARCDALDGVRDGMVQDTQRLPGGVQSRPRRADVQRRARRHLPVGGAEVGHRAGSSPARRRATASRSMPASRTTPGSRLPTGRAGNSARRRRAMPAPWPTSGRCRRPIRRRSTARAFVLASDVDALLAKVQVTDATYTESALSFMLPPHLADMSAVRKRGAKIVIFHGTSDPIFSSDAQRRGLRRAGAAERARTRRPSRGSTSCPA